MGLSKDEKRRIKALKSHPYQVTAAEYRNGRFHLIDEFFGQVILTDMWTPYQGFAIEFDENEFNRMVEQARLLLKEQVENEAQAEAERQKRREERAEGSGMSLPPAEESRGKKKRSRFWPFG